MDDQPLSAMPVGQALDLTVQHTAARIRRAFAEADESGVLFEITMSGRVDGDLKIVYRLASRFGENAVVGTNLEEMIAEWGRRQGWNKLHTPIMIGVRGDITPES